MSKKRKNHITTSNKQPVKEISYQDLYNLKNMLNQLKSCQESLYLLEKILKAKTEQTLIQKSSDCYILLYNYFIAFNKIIKKLEVQIDNLKSRKKI